MSETPLTDAPKPPLAVRVEERMSRVDDTLSATLALREAYGEERVFLLESLSGPLADRRASLLGLTGLLEVSVRRGEVEFEGHAPLVSRARAALRAAGVVDDASRLTSDAALWDLPRVLDTCFDVPRSADSFGFGVMAFYGYDAVRYIEQLPRVIPDKENAVPDAAFSLVHALVACSPEGGQARVSVASSAEWPDVDPEEFCAVLESAPSSLPELKAPPEPESVSDEMTEDVFLELADRCLEHIRVGDIYQVQIGHEITVRSGITPVDVYRRLRDRNPSPYMSLIPVAGHTMLSASPELFVRLEDTTATMRPIAGTARRSMTGDPAVDGPANEKATAALLADPKERAEHIMLVDLCRNDMGRVSVPMSVEVPDLMVIEEYSHMFHIVSNVVSELREDADVYDVIRACFPAGTMTGAPKVRAMEIIESLELSRRGFYAGAFGLIGFGGWTILGLSIRMTVHREDSYVLRASAGIVADSVPAAEWRETLTKLGATFWAVTGKEIL
ncbi:anthranilate synthase component I family protein [Falsarthrobacter nasiphocae]|uniref:Anthranilate synthase component 1 n=1 Tax=Falsarthrobacter nasiphocae TaxID=189863 RepID=A0AAE4C5U0_9MICC|nr:anthranilate synthase component I family protein [Falsarthrobacter nasiphocae]MDR6891833.1 anthranilate synthase component 1 [Falsarthrobacter nasiphocae]